MRCALLTLLFVAMGCQTPREWIYVHERNMTQAHAYQTNMTRIADGTLDAYKRSQKRYFNEKYEDYIEDAASRSPAKKVSPGFAKVMGYWLIQRHDEIRRKTNDVQDLIVEANVDFERLVDGMELLKQKLKARGLQPEHWRLISNVIDETSDELIEKKKTEVLSKLDDKIKILKAELEDKSSNSEATAELRILLREELEKQLKRKKLLEEFLGEDEDE